MAQFIRLTSPQDSPEGHVIHDLYYGGIIDKLLTRSEFSGYPHNGGEHTLVLHVGYEDAMTMLNEAEPYLGRRGKAGLPALKAKLRLQMEKQGKFPCLANCAYQKAAQCICPNAMYEDCPDKI